MPRAGFTRDAVRSFLYDDRTGLPADYTAQDVDGKIEVVFQHVYYAYPRLPSPVYGAP